MSLVSPSFRLALAAVVLRGAVGVQVSVRGGRTAESSTTGVRSAVAQLDQELPQQELTPPPLCGLGSDIPAFPALRVHADPSYLMCLQPEEQEADDHRYGLGLLAHSMALSFAGDEHHCDWLPHLMSSRTDGVFVDVGMNVGACTMLMLSKGYKVYGFEPEPLYFRSSNFSVTANGFADRAHISNLAVAAQPSSATLDSQLGSESKIHVMKLDIDGTELDVLRGATSLLESGKLEVVQIELNVAEQAKASDKLAILQEGLEVHGYKLYALVAEETFEEFLDDGALNCPMEQAITAAGFSLSSMKGHKDLADIWGRGGAAQYGFGDLVPHKFRLVEACSDFVTRCFNQFVAVSPKSSANTLELVSNAVGSC